MAALWAPALHWPHLPYLYNPASSTDCWAPFVLRWQNQSCEEAKITYSHQGLASPVCFTADNVLVTLQQVNAGAQSPECDVKVTWRCCVTVSSFYPTPQQCPMFLPRWANLALFSRQDTPKHSSRPLLLWLLLPGAPCFTFKLILVL